MQAKSFQVSLHPDSDIKELSLSFVKQAKGYCKFSFSPLNNVYIFKNNKISQPTISNLEDSQSLHYPSKSKTLLNFAKIQHNGEVIVINLLKGSVASKNKKVIANLLQHIKLLDFN